MVHRVTAPCTIVFRTETYLGVEELGLGIATVYQQTY